MQSNQICLQMIKHNIQSRNYLHSAIFAPVGTVDVVAAAVVDVTTRVDITRIVVTNRARRVCTVGIIYAIKITIIKRDFSRRSYMPSIVRIIRARRDIKLSVGNVRSKCAVSEFSIN